MCVVVTDKSNGEDPWAIFTGDTMFIGDVGRPDLLVSINRSAKELASELYDSIHNVIMALPDETLVFPSRRRLIVWKTFLQLPHPLLVTNAKQLRCKPPIAKHSSS